MAEKRKIRMAYIILHYRTPEDTRACVGSILRMPSAGESRIVIVDNGSPDGSGEALSREYAGTEQVHVILNGENSGFSRGNNLGYRYALEHTDPDLVTVCNNDIVFPDPDYAERIEAIYRREGFHVLGPDIYNPRMEIHQSPLGTDSPGRKDARRTVLLNAAADLLFPVFWPLIGRKDAERLHHRADSTADWDKAMDNVPLMGACLVLSRDFTAERDTLFAPETFLYYEEYLLFNSCRRAGMKMIYRPEVRVLHHEGSATAAGARNEKERYRRMVKHTRQAAGIYLNDLKRHGD